jgi:hypothetical protein
VNDGSFSYESFRNHFNKDGLTVYGQRMLERAREYEAGGHGQQEG